MYWLAARALTGREYFVRRKIRLLAPEAEIMVPRIYTKIIKDGIVRTRSERMLPGYLLIGTPEILDRDKLKNFVKVIGMVTELEIASIKAIQGSATDILADNMAILVIDGPFQGCRGKIIKQKEDGIMNCRIVFQGMELFLDIDAKLISSLSAKAELGEV